MCGFLGIVFLCLYNRKKRHCEFVENLRSFCELADQIEWIVSENFGWFF